MILTEPSKPDKVHHPSHYTCGDIEVIDYIRDKLTEDGFTDYCIGNVLKYVSRWRHKDGVQDLEKALVYLTWAVENSKKNQTPDIRPARHRSQNLQGT